MATRRQLYFWMAALLMVCLPGQSVGAPQGPDEFDAADDDMYDSRDTDDMKDVDDPDVSSSLRPTFVSTAQHFRVRLGDSVRLPCNISDLGPFARMWKRDDEGGILAMNSLLISKDPRVSYDNESLVVHNISVSDHGDYVCQISTQEPIELRHFVDVLVPPVAKPLPANGVLVVKKGEPAKLGCNVTGNPVPVVTWAREGGKKFPDGQKTMLSDSITFTSTNRHHIGVYECTAENSEGEPSTAKINLQITYAPEIEVELTFISIGEGYNTELTCTVHGEPRPQVSWSKNDIAIDSNTRYSRTNTNSHHVLSIDNVQSPDFGLYTCSAENRFGRDQKTIEISGVPNAATLKRNKPLTNGIELEWATVSHSPIHEYRLRYHMMTSDKWEEMILKAEEVDDNANMGAPITIFNHVHQLHNLEPGSDYELTIESRNKFGWSHPLQTDFTTLQTVTTQVPTTNSPLLSPSSSSTSTSSTSSSVVSEGKAMGAGQLPGSAVTVRSLYSTLATLVLTSVLASLLC